MHAETLSFKLLGFSDSKEVKKAMHICFPKGLGSIRGVFGLMSKISFTLSKYRFVIWDKNYRRYFVV